MADAFAALEKSATENLTEEGAGTQQIVLRRFLDMRYRGQEYTLPVPLIEDLRAVTDFGAFARGLISSIRSTTVTRHLKSR